MKKHNYLKVAGRIASTAFAMKLLVLFGLFPVLAFGQGYHFPDPVQGLGKTFFAPGEKDYFDLFRNPPANHFLFPALADMDGDGDLDLFLKTNLRDAEHPCYLAVSLDYYENIGTPECPSYQLRPVSEPFGIPPHLTILAFKDIDGDQDLDLFSFAWCQSKIFYLENTGTATVPEFGNSSLQTNPFNINPSGIMSAGASFGDLDDDGDYDLILSGRINRPNKEFLYQENMGSATNPLFGPRIPAPGGMLLPRVFDGYMAMSIFDWDCDGDLDVMNTFLIKNGPNELYFHENNSTDPGTPSFLPAVYTGESVFTTIHGDLDGDGDQDVMAGAKVFRNQTTTCRRGPSPVADFSALVDEGAMAVSFTDHSDTKHTACYPVRWSWHFGDGTRSDEQHPVHTYAQGGTYLVGLVVTDVRGSDTAFQEVNLMPREKTTGIEEAMKLPVKLYPNPVSNWLNIEWNDLSAHQELQLTVYDVYGKPVPTGVIRPGLENQVAVDLSHLPAGLYLIEGRAGERYFSEKVLKVDR